MIRVIHQATRGQRLHDIWKNRRKFRSQTSDNMDRWKNRGGKSQRREEKRRKKTREEKESEERRCRCAKKRWRKCMPLWREAHFEVKCVNIWRMGFDTCQKWAKRASFVAVSKTLAGVGHLNRICKDASRVAGAVQETYSSEMLGGQGAGFLRGVRSSGLPRRFCVTARCSTSYDLASLFHGSRCALDRWGGKIGKRIGTRPLALHSAFHFWRTSRRIALVLTMSTPKTEESRRIASFLMLSTPKIEESRRITSFWMLSTSKAEEVSKNCFVLDVVNFEFKLADRQKDR